MLTETDIANLAIGKIGGAGDALNGNATISSIDDNNKVAAWCKTLLPHCRRRSIKDLAKIGCPFRETLVFADLGAEVDADSLPETGQYTYAFDLPGDCLVVIKQFNETEIARRQSTVGHNWETVANKNRDGKLFLTDTLSNLDNTSAFIEYCIDIESPSIFSEELIECIATLMASALCPVLGKGMDEKKRMSIEYQFISVPDAQKFNQSQFNGRTDPTTDYTGGRAAVRRERL